MFSIVSPIRPKIQYFRCTRTFTSASDVTAIGDSILLRLKQDPTKTVFTKRLKPRRTVNNHFGFISHDALIGKRAREVVTFSKGKEFRIHFPTLEEYVTLTPRLVTPIYPADAHLIVSFLDIHVSPAESSPNGSRLEILEAGTGHGALTLYLARAIHAANPACPAPQTSSLTDQRTPPLAENGVSHENIADQIDQAYETTLQDWKSKRKAVIHTVDVSAAHSQNAKRIFSGFRRGIYAGDADFYVGDVSQWIDQQFAARRQEDPELPSQSFLSHAILDMPSSYKHLEKVASAIHTDGILLVFNPSVTQISACVELIKNQKLPLILDKVIEVGAGMSGGRPWDIRAVKPRALKTKESEPTAGTDDVETEEVEREPSSPGVTRSQRDNNFPSEVEEGRKEIQDGQGDWEMICRPKPAAIYMGGGFVGVWRKMQHVEASVEKLPPASSIR